MPQLNLLFIRHGETQDNIDRVLQGWHDTSLTPKGHHEAQILADKISTQPLDAIYHSPLTRIRQTIAPLMTSRPDIPVYADPDLRGQTLGELEGGSYDLVDMSNPRSADNAAPGVENFDDFVRRVLRSFGRIVAVEAGKCKDGNRERERTVAIATHGVAITALFKTLEKTPDCDRLLERRVARRGEGAWEVRWTDSDDVARLVVARPETLPVEGGKVNWERVVEEPFVIVVWGKKEKAL